MKKSATMQNNYNIWHPYTQAKGKKPPLLFSYGKGAFLYTESGEKYLDATSSWWVNLHGHAHPYIAKKISDQAHILEHMMFTDFTHKPAIELTKRLLKLLPKEFSKIFYSDNGSTAIETALKIAIQFWKNKKKKRIKILSLEGGFHGDTFGAMAVSGKNPFNCAFRSYLFEVTQIAPPFLGKEEKAIVQLKKEIQNEDVICLLYEPLIQGASGMRIYSQEGFEEMLKLCREKNILLIADEVMTGFGRTGPLFASDFFSLKPDIIAFAKGITGGFLPLGATVCQEHVFASFFQKIRKKLSIMVTLTRQIP